MAINKATLSKKLDNGIIEYVYPKTSSDMVIYGTTTVEKKLDEIQSTISSGVGGVEGNINAHIEDKNNPHNVTTAQIGAAEADEVEAARTAKSDSTAKDSLKLRLDADYDALDTKITNNAKTAADAAAAVQTNLNNHTSNTDNPHNVTIAQIGAASATEVSNARTASSDGLTKTTLSSRLSADYNDLVTKINQAVSGASDGSAAVQDNLNTHIADKNNPHNVTASQVGLGNVPNVTTNNQTPTYTEAATLSVLVSGETLATSMGKLQKAITDEIAHIENHSNPHNVTADQIGAVPTTRTINGKALSDNITLVPADIGALASDANAATATEFSSGTTVSLSGDATGTSASSTKGWSVPVTLSNSGVTAGSYGPTADASPAHGGSFKVPYITVDAKGRATAAVDRTITLPGETALSKGTTSGDGNAVTEVNVSGHTVTLVKGATFATKSELDELAATASNAMYYKGTIGTDGSITALPTASKTVLGHTYKVITAGSYGGWDADVGDVLICKLNQDGTTYSWDLVPSGDEPDGTVTNIALKAGNGLTIDNTDPITTSGTRTFSHADTSSQGSLSAADRTYVTGVTLDDFGHVTGLTTGKETVTDTHYTSGTVVTNSATGITNTTSALSNGNVYLNHVENGVLRNSHKIIGSGSATVTSDSSGNITVNASDTTYSIMTGATAAADGSAGLVPAPGAGKQNAFLRGDGTWGVPTDTTYGVMSGASATSAGASGLVPAPAAGKQTSFLRGDGTWAVPIDTTYSEATTSAAGLMSASDKLKLDGIEDGAEVNIFETIKVNNSIVAPDASRAVNISVPTGALASKDSIAETDLAAALATKINGKANTSDLAAIATSGNVADLTQSSGDIIIIDCGSATVNI